MSTSIRRSAAWLFAGGTSTQILNFIFGIILARILAPDDFGMLVTINIFTGLVGFMAGGGMGQALIRSTTAEKIDFDVVFTIQTAIGLLIFAALFLIAPFFASWYQNPLYADLLRASSLNFVLRPFVSIPTSLLTREMRFKELAIINVLALIVTNIVSIALAFGGFAVWSLILGGLVGSLAKALALKPISGWKLGLCFEFRRGRELAKYGMLTTLGDFIVHIRRQSTNFILSKTMGPQFLGLFNKADSLALIPHAQITGSVYQVTFRVLSKEQEDLSKSRYLFLRSVTLVGFYTWPLLLAMGWLAHPLISTLYGEKWLGAAPALMILAFFGPFIMLEILAGSVLAARNWLSREIPIQITQLIVVILGVLIGLPYGLTGVALGAISANIYGGMHMTWLAARCLNIPIMSIIKAMITPFLMNLSVFLLWVTIDNQLSPKLHLNDFLYLAAMLITGGFIYLSIFFFIPIESLKSERQRWIDHAAQIFGLKR